MIGSGPCMKEITMIETPEVTNAQPQAAAVIHIVCPREQIQSEIGPAIKEIMAALAAQSQNPVGPMFMHHLTMSASHFDVEVGLPVDAPVSASGRVKSSGLPAARVARTIYHGSYEGLHSAWDAFGRRLVRDQFVDPAVIAPVKTLWERYLVGPETTRDASQWRTELNLPLAT
jgi:effector-binding domain-containing protein